MPGKISIIEAIKIGIDLIKGIAEAKSDDGKITYEELWEVFQKALKDIEDALQD